MIGKGVVFQEERFVEKIEDTLRRFLGKKGVFENLIPAFFFLSSSIAFGGVLQHQFSSLRSATV